MPDALAVLSAFADLGIAGWCLRLVLGAVVGFLIGLTGVGGGVLAVPAIQLGLGFPPALSIGTASLYAFLSQGMTAIAHWRLANVRRDACLAFLLGAVPGSLVVANLISRWAGSQQMQLALNVTVLLVMLVSLVLVYRAPDRSPPMADLGATAAPRPRRPLSRRQWSLGAFAGLFAGTVIGATSIGGGVLIIPIMLTVFQMDLRLIVGSAAASACVITLVTACAYGGHGQLDLATALIMSCGSIAGVLLGSPLAMRLPRSRLRWLMIAIMILAVIGIAVKLWGQLRAG